MIQRSNPPAPLFDQPKTKAFFDPSRAQTQLECVAKVMRDGAWRTPSEIQALMSVPARDSAVTARLRDLCKPMFGSHEVETRQRKDAPRGTIEYRLIWNQ